jgi:hypothetical protein
MTLKDTLNELLEEQAVGNVLTFCRPEERFWPPEDFSDIEELSTLLEQLNHQEPDAELAADPDLGRGTHIRKVPSEETKRRLIEWMRENNLPNAVHPRDLHVSMFKTPKTYDWKGHGEPITVPEGKFEWEFRPAGKKMQGILNLDHPGFAERREAMTKAIGARSQGEHLPHMKMSHDIRGWRPPQGGVRPIKFPLVFDREETHPYIQSLPEERPPRPAAISGRCTS